MHMQTIFKQNMHKIIVKKNKKQNKKKHCHIKIFPWNLKQN
jgi:hypothetical protein